MRAGGLHQGVVRAGEHGLRIREGVHLSRPRLFAGLEVAHEPVALEVEVLDGLGRGHGLHHLGLLLQAHLLQVGLHVCFGALLLLDGLCVRRALGSGLRHELLVLGLRVLLLDLYLLQLLVEVGHQHAHHVEDAGILLALLRVGAEGLRRRRRRIPPGPRRAVRGDLDEARGQLRIVEGVQALRRKLQDFLGSGVGRERLGVLCMLGLPVLSGLRHAGVQFFDALLQGSNLLRERCDHALGVIRCLLQVRDCEVEALLLVLCLVQ
mmetsp:Transcript_93822/g.261193  ORF Transcript_93822/g.261193 Transcript_93822/m.261193 type:complete len:265 (-) Transcript_93822:667-1461(-)